MTIAQNNHAFHARAISCNPTHELQNAINRRLITTLTTTSMDCPVLKDYVEPVLPLRLENIYFHRFVIIHQHEFPENTSNMKKARYYLTHLNIIIKENLRYHNEFVPTRIWSQDFLREVHKYAKLVRKWVYNEYMAPNHGKSIK